MFEFDIINNHTYYPHPYIKKGIGDLYRWRENVPFILGKSGREKPASNA